MDSLTLDSRRGDGKHHGPHESRDTTAADPYRRAMGLFRRKAPTDSPAAPPERGSCSCTEHVEDLAGLVVPVTAQYGTDLEPSTVGELLEMQALGTSPAELTSWRDHETGEVRGPFHWELWLGDETRASYDDDASLPMDESLLARPGIESVEWEDREVFHLAAPTLCADGVLAAAARALLDPRVRQ